jgi:hypothetical protein
MKKYMILLIMFEIIIAIALDINATEVFLESDNAKVGKGILVEKNGTICIITPGHVVSGSSISKSLCIANKYVNAHREANFEQDISILKIIVDSQISECKPSKLERIEDLNTILEDNTEGVLSLRLQNGGYDRIPVIITKWGPLYHYIEISPKKSDRLLSEGMSGSTLRINDDICGMLLSVNRTDNRGHVIRQDFLHDVVSSYFKAQKPRPRKKKFRSKPINRLSGSLLGSIAKKYGFFDSVFNNSGAGFSNDYVLQNDGEVVYDRASGLMWQQSGSYNMTFADAKEYVNQLNQDRFAGYNDWRLPTVDESMSLMERKENNDDLYIDSVFDSIQRYIWTSDGHRAKSAYVAKFMSGNLGSTLIRKNDYFVRAVR